MQRHDETMRLEITCSTQQTLRWMLLLAQKSTNYSITSAHSLHHQLTDCVLPRKQVNDTVTCSNYLIYNLSTSSDPT